jgi:plasmid stabilization system protein ParE
MEIFVTKRAEKNYHSVLKYIQDNFGNTVSKIFEDKVVLFFDLLEIFPEIGIEEDSDKQLRSFPIAKQTRVFYRIKKDKIIILSFFLVAQGGKSQF